MSFLSSPISWGFFYDAPPGAKIQQVAKVVLTTCKSERRCQGFVFNGLAVRVDPDEDTVVTIVEKYNGLHPIQGSQR